VVAPQEYVNICSTRGLVTLHFASQVEGARQLLEGERARGAEREREIEAGAKA